MKPKTIKRKIQDVVKSGILGLPNGFKSPLVDDFITGLLKYQGNFVSEKRPLHLPLLHYVLAIVPWDLTMGTQFGCAMVVSVFCCLRQSEFSVNDKMTSNKYLLLRKVSFSREAVSPGEGRRCFHETD